jgi:hypothetical protein
MNAAHTKVMRMKTTASDMSTRYHSLHRVKCPRRSTIGEARAEPR